MSVVVLAPAEFEARLRDDADGRLGFDPVDTGPLTRELRAT